MRKSIKQVSQRLCDFLKADRQWRRMERIGHARRKFRDAMREMNHAEREFWNSVLAANGASNRHIEPSTRYEMGDFDKHGRTGDYPPMEEA